MLHIAIFRAGTAFAGDSVGFILLADRVSKGWRDSLTVDSATHDICRHHQTQQRKRTTAQYTFKPIIEHFRSIGILSFLVENYAVDSRAWKPLRTQRDPLLCGVYCDEIGVAQVT